MPSSGRGFLWGIWEFPMIVSSVRGGAMQGFAEVGFLDFLDARFISHFRAIVRHLSTGSVASDEVGAVCELIDSVLFLDGRV
jgi:hypothetical protein